MHFLSHYYTELPAGHPLFVTALILPDLSQRFSKTYNSVIRHAKVPDEERLQLIHLGILNHYNADAKFHNSEPFMQHTALALQSMLSEGLDRKRLRLSVVAHLIIEMLLDRHIILNNESVCDEFYMRIVQADETMLETYFDHFALDNEKRRFLTNFRFFKQRKFLYLFKDIENIVSGLNRVYGSVTKTDFTEEEKSRFLSAFHNIDKQMRYSWKNLLKL